MAKAETTKAAKDYIVTAHNGVAHATGDIVAHGKNVTTACGMDVVLMPFGASFGQWAAHDLFPQRRAPYSGKPMAVLVRCHKCWIKATGQAEDPPATIKESLTVAKSATTIAEPATAGEGRVPVSRSVARRRAFEFGRDQERLRIEAAQEEADREQEPGGAIRTAFGHPRWLSTKRHWIAEVMPYFAVVGVGATIWNVVYSYGWFAGWWR